jgi:putative transposase
MDSRLLNGSLTNTKLNSWFTVLCQKKEGKEQENLQENRSEFTTNMLSLISLIPSSTDPEEQITESKGSNIQGIQTIKLKPNQEQKMTLNFWMGAFRFFYNKSVALYHQNKGKVNLKTLRQNLINESAMEQSDWKWAKDVPYDIKDDALRDFMKAVNANKAKVGKAKKDGKKATLFEMKFKSKKRSNDCIVIQKKHWEHATGKYAFLNQIKGSEKIPEHLPTDSRLIKENGEFNLKLAVTNRTEVDNQDRRERSIVALDPGIRTFMAGYDPSGYAFEWGRMDSKRLCRLYYVTSKLQKEMHSKETRHKKRLRLKRCIAKIWRRIQGLVDDCHYKLIKFLTSSYQTVIIPTFGVKNMLKTLKSKDAKQKMALWSHYRFRQRLLSRAKLQNVKVLVVTEEYTSRTCTRCGVLNPKSVKKEKKCVSCKLKIDRDINGSRNILLKTLTEASALMC